MSAASDVPRTRREPGGSHPAGFVGVRVREARNPRPGEDERDHALEPYGRRTRNNEAGRAVLGARTPAREGFKTCSLQTSRQHSPFLLWVLHLRCPIPGDQQSNELDNREQCLQCACNHCRGNTATRVLVIGNIFQDRRQPIHQERITNGPTHHRLPTSPVRGTLG